MSLALFDLDETLINGDCASLWSRYMFETGWAGDAAFVRREQEMMLQYVQGTLSMDEYMSFTLQPLAGRSVEEVAHHVRGFIAKAIVPVMRTNALRCIAAHRDRGDRVIVISASGEHLVKPIAERFGVRETLSIELAVRDARYTGETKGILTYREGKVARLAALLDGDLTALAEASFYSDSGNDLPLLVKVGDPHAVNPDGVLLNHARRARWPIHHW
ncbi:HAD family hydrolase [Martelella alba]|uniref:HAD family hydrolase n=1 Tax=Martelella alba TaxID=2590451 RepID=A0ABY2SHJ1_9HYPH|nr:HAD family hydrolase [Martelella alba]TKI04413.1 HAD family hydrolase [Martelella alba]